MVRLIKQPSESVDECYAYGSCMFLAVALARTFNLEIQCVMKSDRLGTYIDHAWVVQDGMVIDINGRYPPERNGYVADPSLIVGDLDEAGILAILRGYTSISRSEWDDHIKEAVVVVHEYFEQE